MDAISVNEILGQNKDRTKRVVGGVDASDGLDAKKAKIAISEDLLAAVEEEDVEALDETAVKKLIANFHKKLELNTSIQEMHGLATMPSLYPLLEEQKSDEALLALLSHDNKDISIAVLNLLQELTDVETMEDGDENVVKLVESVDKATEEGLLNFLMKRVRHKAPFDANKLYASEILALLLQQCQAAKESLSKGMGIDNLLQSLAGFKRHNPGSADEREMMENLFNALCAALLHIPNRKKFLDGEGLQLMNLMLREKKDSRESALKVLDYATTGPEGKDNCDKFVDIFGLRTLFPLFMRTPNKSKRRGNSSEEHEEHAIAVVASLLRNCNGKNRERVIQKFVEGDHVKVDRLVELYLKYRDHVKTFEKQAARNSETAGMDEDELYLTKLEEGLFTLQLLCAIVADVCINGPSSIRSQLAKLMAMKGGSLVAVKGVLSELRDNLGDEGGKEELNRISNLINKL